MKNKIILITGASDGIGKQTALELAEMGAHVIMHGRNEDKTSKAAEEVKTKSGNNNVDIIIADLSSFESIRRMSDAIHSEYDHIDVLINNAGVQIHSHETSADGYELTFAVNHLAYFLLTSLLLDLVKQSEYKRMVIVASQLHSEDLDFDNLQAEKGYSLYPIYAQSKLCNIMFSFLLAKRLDGFGITVNCLHPGLIDTNLNPKRDQSVVDRALPVEKGSIASVYLSSSSEIVGVTGNYYLNDASVGRPREIAFNEELQLKLWNLSEEMIGEKFNF
ncbi:MAG: SDR family oxidoreductase [Candidatus Heimdallarchaeota archaeon]|nr:SDR family oxidoreductase [Candidatus Heimdallarchaeota archaeon]